jgi:hypothetical protein
MAEAYIWRWTGIDGRMLAQTLGCLRQFGVVASLGQPAGRILLLVRVEVGQRTLRHQ